MADIIQTLNGGFVSAVIGALSALIFQAVWAHKELRDRQHSAICQTLIRLILKRRSLLDIKKEIESRNDGGFLSFIYEDSRIDLDGLYFVSTGRHANTVQDIALADIAYAGAAERGRADTC